MVTSPVREFLLFHLPEKCYDEIFVNLHMHVPCLKYIMSKISGLWMLLDILFAPTPQLLKILRRGSAAGLSLPSALLQFYSFSCPVVYARANNIPLFAWGEMVFSLAQSATIVFLILHYRRDTLKGMLFLLAYSGVMFLLGCYAAEAVTSMMQTSSLFALTTSKVLQAGTNYCNGYTGQLSSLSVFLSWVGSLGVVFVSLKETGSLLASLLHILSACLSCVLLTQILCYRSSTTEKKIK